MNKGQLAGVGAITITSILWGTTGTAATFAPEVGPLAIGAAALGIGGLLQAAIAIPALRTERGALYARMWTIVIGSVAVAIYPLAFYSSMHFAGVAIGSVVSLASAPLASGVLERVVDQRQLSGWWMLAAGLGIIGSVLLCLSKIDDRTFDPTATMLGIVLGLVAGTTYAIYSWVAHRFMMQGISRAASMGAVFGGGGLLLMPVLLITGAPLVASSEGFLVASYMALLPMFLGYLLFGFGLTRVSASTATTVTLTEPAVATLLAVVVVGERLEILGWAGLSFIVVVLLILVFASTNVSVLSESGPLKTASAKAQRPTADVVVEASRRARVNE